MMDMQITQPQTGSAAGTFGGVKGIKDSLQSFGTNAYAVILPR